MTVSRTRTSRTRAFRVLVILVLAAELAFYLLGAPLQLSVDQPHLDLDVYRLAGQQWSRGSTVYGTLVTSNGSPLPFTYPPLAASLFAAFALVSLPVAGFLLTVLSIAVLAAVLWLFLPETVRRGPDAPWAVLSVLAAALLTEPVRSTLNYGQVNVLLMALVAADVLVPDPRWRRGTLIGLAAAVKLTPAAFVLLPLLRRDGRTVLTSALSFLGFTALGFVLAPADSREYWGHTLLDPARPGNPTYGDNQNVRAVLARYGIDGAGLTVSWLVLSAVVLAVTVVAVRRALAAERAPLALALTALGALLVSPVSWSHHWVWAVPCVLVLALLAWETRSRWATALAVSGSVVLLAAFHRLFVQGGDVELAWPWWTQLLASSYTWWAVLVLVVMALRARA